MSNYNSVTPEFIDELKTLSLNTGDRVNPGMVLFEIIAE